MLLGSRRQLSLRRAAYVEHDDDLEVSMVYVVERIYLFKERERRECVSYVEEGLKPVQCRKGEGMEEEMPRS